MNVRLICRISLMRGKRMKERGIELGDMAGGM